MGAQVQVTTALVATPGTQIQISTTHKPCMQVIIQAKPDNAGSVFIGDQDVESGVGIELIKPSTTKNDMLVVSSLDGTNSIDPTQFWVDAATGDDEVIMMMIYK